MRTWGTIGLGVLLLGVTACGSTGDENGSATTAEIHCETWVSRHLGLPTDDLQFDHRPTTVDDAPSYRVLGEVVGGGQTLAYDCRTTFDGAESWTLDGLDVVDVEAELGG